MPFYTWSFPTLGVVFNEAGMINVIQTVNWILTARNNNFTTYASGVVTLPSPSPASFIPYDQVTEGEVEAWTKEALGAEELASIYAKLDYQLQRMNPTGANLPPPWTQQE